MSKTKKKTATKSINKSKRHSWDRTGYSQRYRAFVKCKKCGIQAAAFKALPTSECEGK